MDRPQPHSTKPNGQTKSRTQQNQMDRPQPHSTKPNGQTTAALNKTAFPEIVMQLYNARAFSK